MVGERKRERSEREIERERQTDRQAETDYKLIILNVLRVLYEMLYIYETVV